jgi:cellulose synthase/poly-beta-1,6-N-acetylglucosamine synthase-like glycosyltransferase
VATSFFILSFLSNKKKEVKLLSDDELLTVSVIIPAYNEEKSIAKTINSILNSDYPANKFEVIVVDDGSKDKTLEIARAFENKRVKIFTKPNGGKASALNFGISKAKGEIIFTMDADTHVDPSSMKKMVRLFNQDDIVSVTPAMLTTNPETILQRVQYMEYMLGLFLRKAFASLDAIYISPGAFSAYRKVFFDKYGGYKVGNITEDLEMSLRIQSHGFIIQNCPEALVYTIAPRKFKELMVQRRRWYFGLIKNTIQYKHILSKKYGDLGAFVFPIAWISTFFAIFIAGFMLVKAILNLNKEMIFLQTINFHLFNQIDINLFAIERFFFLLFTDPVFWFVFIFMILSAVYVKYASKKIGKISGLFFNLPIFFLLFSTLYSFWWIISIIHALFSKDVEWR